MVKHEMGIQPKRKSRGRGLRATTGWLVFVLAWIYISQSAYATPASSANAAMSNVMRYESFR